MKVVCETELMKNQTHAQLLTPGGRLRALKTQEGRSLFFSLGTDSILYVTREGGSDKTGWGKVDLSSSLAERHPGAAIAAVGFDVSQNPQSGNIDVALAINDGVTDHLYVSQSNANTEDAWAQGVPWKAVPYDASTQRPNLRIADLYLLQTPAGDLNRYFIADVVGDGNLLFRYFIDPDRTIFPNQSWNQHFLPFDAEAGTVTSCMGQWPNDDVAGIYTFGQIGGTRQLQYQRTVSSESGTTARVYEFALPTNASAIACSLDLNGNSHFFVAAEGALHFYPPEQEGVSMQVGTPVVSHSFFAGVTQLHAASSGDSTLVWAINQDKHLAYMHCPAGSESDAGAWSPPARVLDQVHRIAPFINVDGSNSVVFAHRVDTSAAGAPTLIKFTQDPVTTEWRRRGVPIPTSSINHLVEYESYTTHIQVTDDDNIPVSDATVTVTVASPLTIYANGASHTLAPNAPLALAADITGVLTIVQETDSLTGICFDVSAARPGTAPVTAGVRPMQKPVDRLRTIRSGSDLTAVRIRQPDGRETSLLPAKTSPGDAHTTAQLLQKLVSTYDALPQNGAKQTPKALLGRAAAMEHVRRAAASGTIAGVVREAGGLTWYEGEAAAARVGLLPGAPELDPGSFFSWLWGDIFGWLKFAWDKVESFFVTVADGIYSFVIKIGEVIYHVVADTIYAVAQAFEYAFNAIKVAFEDLVRWIGFIFDWDDIVRTHKVLKTIVKTYAQRAIDRIPQLEQEIRNVFSTLDQRIDSWAGLPGPAGSVGGTTRKASAPGQNRPQSHWALHHLKNNLMSSATSYAPKRGGDDSIIADLVSAFRSEEANFKKAVTQLQAVFGNTDHVRHLTLAEIFKAVVGILAELILDTLETVLLLGVKVLAGFASGVISALDTVIEIPIISHVYKLIAGDALTVLDLACLVIAIPVTIIYKIKADAAPYPDNATTQSLISAKTFEDVRAILVPADAEDMAPGEISKEALKIATLALDVGALFGAFGTVIVNAMKSNLTTAEPVWPLNLAAASLYLVYVAPNITSALSDQGAWYNAVNDFVTGMSVAKTLIDNITPLASREDWTFASPWLEMAINALWLVPAFGSFIAHHSVADGFAFVGNLMFDAGGILTPVAIQDGEVINPDVWALTMTLSIGYGVCALGAGVVQLFPTEEEPRPAPGGRAGR